MTDSERDEIARLTNVTIERTGEQGHRRTCVRADTKAGSRILFVFTVDDPSAGDVLMVAQAIDALRVVANKRPHVGHPG